MNQVLYSIKSIMINQYKKDISMYDDSFLYKVLKTRSKGFTEVSKYLDLLSYDPSEAEQFYESLNINYSVFFRDPLTFALLEQHIIPSLINKKPDGGEIRIWSAGCAYGQEAYSLAMLVDDLIDSNAYNNIKIRIFATDISMHAINVAKQGIYNKCAVGNVKLKYLNKYFIEDKENYVVKPEIKKSISFSTYDLIDESLSNPPESIYGDFDIIFCSNLLFYYKADIKKYIINKLHKSASNTGYLITGDTESTIIEKSQKWKACRFSSAIFRKTNDLLSQSKTSNGEPI